MVLALVFAFFVSGLIVGSFLGAFTYRYPRGISISDGRSFCPQCKKMIHAYDNIPLISFILLKGKCRSCKTKISFREPALELFTATLFALIFFVWSTCSTSMVSGSFCAWSTTLPFSFIFLFLFIFSCLIAIFVIDLEHQIIPDILTFIPLGIVLLLLVLVRADVLYSFVFSGFLAGVFLLVLHLITFGKGMGLGDVKFSLLGGFLLGFPLTLVWIFMSFIIGSIVGVFLIFIKATSFGKQIPFGPFLVIALLITFLFGDTIVEAFSFMYF